MRVVAREVLVAFEGVVDDGAERGPARERRGAGAEGMGADRDVREGQGTLPVSEALAERCLGIPWFKHNRPDQIAPYAAAFKKVALQADRLLAASAH